MQQPENKKMDIVLLWRSMCRFWWLIVIFSLLGAIGGWVWAVWVVKPQYKATALIFAWADMEKAEMQSAENATADDGKSGKKRSSKASAREDVRLQQERTLAKLRGYQMLMQQLTIGDLLMPDFKALLNSRKLRSKIDEQLHAKYPDYPRVQYTLSVNPLPKTRFVEVSVYCGNKDMAPLIVNEVVAIFSAEARELLGVNNTQIIDKAQGAVEVSSRPLVCAVFGFLLGLAGSIAIAFLVDFFDKSIRSIKDLENILNLPVLGVLPEFTDERNDSLRALATQSAYGEAIRALRVNVEYLLPESGGAKIFLISSVNKGDGKSSIMANLALSIAQVEKRILLVDVDLRRPRQHRIFKLSNKQGVVDLLVSRKKFEDLVQRDVKVKGLDVLCCGTIPMNPTDLLGSRKLEDFLREQSANYDYIFLDAPPALGFADPMILGKLADSMLIACNYRTANTDKLRMIIEGLRKSNVRIGGMIINRFQMQKRGGYYYDYSHYYYYQYTSDKNIDEADGNSEV